MAAVTKVCTVTVFACLCHHKLISHRHPPLEVAAVLLCTEKDERLFKHLNHYDKRELALVNACRSVNGFPSNYCYIEIHTYYNCIDLS